MESFSHKLKQITFKTFHRNQLATFDYDDLFSNRRVLIFSITNAYTRCSGLHIKSFELAYQKLLDLGLDNVYAIDSTDWLVGPMMDKKSADIIGLPDRDLKFVESVAELANNKNDIIDLARFWQYVILINNGEPEKLWRSPFKKQTSLSILKNPDVRYRGIGVNTIEKYLVDNQA
jgi:peroxiredoxin